MGDRWSMRKIHIQDDHIYMAVINGKEVRILVDTIQHGLALGKNLETNGGILVPLQDIVAGPLKEKTRLFEKE